MGDALVVNTTHLKQGWLRRNGLPESDQATMVEFIVRHGDHLVDTTIVTDPVFLTEPEVRSDDFFRQPADHGAWLYACDDGEQIIGRAPDAVPNYSFGAQPFAKEYSHKYKIPCGIRHCRAPRRFIRSSSEKLKTSSDAEAVALLEARTGAFAGQPGGGSGTARRGNSCMAGFRDSVYMLLGDGGNIVVRLAIRDLLCRQRIRAAHG